ncbi:wax ester/triacylglycerol synthase family O-acyltransferase [Rhodococcus sp. NPDC019627]|uniref:WS/DGAT/MGAT family O-acyltransferase n=1 Tax=unclassified Rhodococcus (in: high G+C Gram-positive bacteria) TaxID=192944 RepID=UPI0033F8F357
MLLPMSPVDSLFLLGESRGNPMHVGCLQLFEPPDGADAMDVRSLFDRTLADTEVSPKLRERARRSWSTLGQWGWEEDENFDLGHHIRHDALARPGGMAELFALCSRLHGTLLDRHRPLWEVHLIEGLADGRYGVYTKLHHAVADGVSGMKMLHGALSKDPGDRNMPPPWVKAGRPTHLRVVRRDETPSPSSAARVLAAAGSVVRDTASIVPALASATEKALRAQSGHLAFTAPKTMFNVPIAAAREFAARSWAIERLERIADVVDYTVNDVVLAMCAGALRTYMQSLAALPDRALIAMVPVSLRNEARESRTGNDVGLLMCNLATDLADPARRLAAIRSSMLEGKSALRAMNTAQVLALSAISAAPQALTMLLGRSMGMPPPFNVVISNVAGPRTPRYWNGARLDALYPLSIPVDGQALNITCTSRAGDISFGLTGCRRTVPRLLPMLDYLDDELRALEEAVGT